MAADLAGGGWAPPRLLLVLSRVSEEIVSMDNVNEVRWLLDTVIREALELLGQSGDGLIQE